MPRRSRRSPADDHVAAAKKRSAARQAVHGVFDNLRRDPRPADPGSAPYQATLSGMPHSGRSSAIVSYVLSRAVDDAIQRGLLPDGTDKRDVATRQDLVVDICVPELLARMPARVAAESLCQPALFLRWAGFLVRRDITELILLQGFDELLLKPSDTHGSDRNFRTEIGLEAVEGFSREVDIPVVHVGSPNQRNSLSSGSSFCRTWRWEVDMFSIESDGANAAYMMERFQHLGLQDTKRGGYPAKPDPKTGYLPGVVFDPGGNKVGYVSPPALAEAVKSCGPGSSGFAIDLYRDGPSFSVLLRFEPAANPA